MFNLCWASLFILQALIYPFLKIISAPSKRILEHHDATQNR